MSYYDSHWDYCYNTAYIVLGNEKAKIMLDALKESGGPHAFVSSSKESFRNMMKAAMENNSEVTKIVIEYIKGVEIHNAKFVAKVRERARRRKQSRIRD